MFSILQWKCKNQQIYCRLAFSIELFRLLNRSVWMSTYCFFEKTELHIQDGQQVSKPGQVKIPIGKSLWPNYSIFFFLTEWLCYDRSYITEKHRGDGTSVWRVRMACGDAWGVYMIWYDVPFPSTVCSFTSSLMLVVISCMFDSWNKPKPVLNTCSALFTFTVVS